MSYPVLISLPKRHIINYWAPCILLVGVTSALYSGVASHNFVQYDDDRYVSNNPLINQGISWQGLIAAFTSLNMGISYWHPLTWISHQLDCELYGVSAGWHKATNVCLHTVNAWLIYCLLRRFPLSPYGAFLISALFAWHPSHVESVAWISERKDVLSTVFALLTLHCYADYAKSRSIKNYLLVAVFFACALMSKPMVVTLPILMLLLDYWPLIRTPEKTRQPGANRGIVLEKIPLLAMSLAVASLTYAAQKDLGVIATRENLSIAFRIANALQSLSWYAWIQFVPTNLAAAYPYPNSFSPTSVILSLSFLVAMGTMAVKCRRKHPFITVGWIWFLVTVFPVIGLIQSSTQARADRYTYFSSLGLFLILIGGLNTFVRHRRKFIFVNATAVAAAIYLPATRAQISYWKDSETLFRRAVSVTKENSRMHRALGGVMDWELASNEAEFHLTQAVALAPESFRAYGTLAEFYEYHHLRRTEIIFLRKSLFWNPEQPKLIERLEKIQSGPHRGSQPKREHYTENGRTKGYVEPTGKIGYPKTTKPTIPSASSLIQPSRGSPGP